MPNGFEEPRTRPEGPFAPPSDSGVAVLPSRDPVARMQAMFPRSYGSISDEDAEEMIRAIEEACESIDGE